VGARYGGRTAGSFGAIGVFSFNGNKIITSSGGGMLVSQNQDWVDRARFLATQARDPAPHYQHSEIGYNYRLSNLLAAVVLAQLRGLDRRIASRRRINDRYRKALRRVPEIEFMPIAATGEPNYWLTCVTIDEVTFGATPEDIRIALEALDIETRPVWKPLHLQPAFSGYRCRGGDVAERIFRRGLCLPSGSALADADIDRVVEGVIATKRREAPLGE
jgi:pyridoxal phosphate-dependent aminotransferase EpsN